MYKHFYRLGDAAELIMLYHIVHPSASSAVTKCQSGQEVKFIKVSFTTCIRLLIIIFLSTPEAFLNIT